MTTYGMAKTKHHEDLEREIRLMHLAATRMEKDYREANYSPDVWINLDLNSAMSDEDAIKAVEKTLHLLARRNRLNSHISYFGYWDVQESRKAKGLGEVIHFHLFAESDDKRWLGKWKQHIGEIWGEYGRSVVLPYDPKRGGIVYSARHGGDLADGVACPKTESQCKRNCKYCMHVNGREIPTEAWYLRNHTQESC